jgi:exodeoxyribonuclease-3
MAEFIAVSLNNIYMKVASFNVNSLRARLPVVLRWLGKHQPDVLCVQETKVQDVDFPAGEFDKTDYGYVFKGQKSYNGVAIFGRSEIVNVQYGFADEPKDEARLIRAEINGVFVVNTYVPQGYMPESEKFEYKLGWFRRLRRYFDENFRSTDAVLWVGDFNIAPEAKDVYDPETLLGHVCYHPEVHKVLNEVMEWGFVDVFRMHCAEQGQYTFWDYRLRDSFRRNLGWRLDHIMATKTLAQKCSACYIDKDPRLADRPSDHTPIVAEFE